MAETSPYFETHMQCGQQSVITIYTISGAAVSINIFLKNLNCTWEYQALRFMATDTGFTYYYFLNYHFRTFITVSLIDGGCTCLKGTQFKEGSTVVVCLLTNHSKMLGCLQSWLKCCFAQWWNSFINDVMKNKTGDKINNCLNPNKSGRETALATINMLPS